MTVQIEQFIGVVIELISRVHKNGWLEYSSRPFLCALASHIHGFHSYQVSVHFDASSFFSPQVGGEYFETVLANMNTFGRVAVCGAISQYNLTEPPKFRPVSGLILLHQLKVEGFMVNRWFSQWPGAFKEIAKWIQEVCKKAGHSLTVTD